MRRCTDIKTVIFIHLLCVSRQKITQQYSQQVSTALQQWEIEAQRSEEQEEKFNVGSGAIAEFWQHCWPPEKKVLSHNIQYIQRDDVASTMFPICRVCSDSNWRSCSRLEWCKTRSWRWSESCTSSLWRWRCLNFTFIHQFIYFFTNCN